MNCSKRLKVGVFMITIKDFAAQQGCSETIVYRHIRNHKEALGDRVQKTHGKTWLTDEGAEYIRSLMTQAPIVVSETSDLVKYLEEENKQLLQALNAAKDKIIELTEQNGQLAIEAKNTELLEADNAAKEKEKEILEGFIKDAKAEIEAQKAENAVLSADNKELGRKVAEAEKTVQKASDELENERTRPITFKEFWHRRKNRKL